jgi:hypothetical protein
VTVLPLDERESDGSPLLLESSSGRRWRRRGRSWAALERRTEPRADHPDWAGVLGGEFGMKGDLDAFATTPAKSSPSVDAVARPARRFVSPGHGPSNPFARNAYTHSAGR